MFARGIYAVGRVDAIGGVGVDVRTHDVCMGGLKLRIAIYVWLHVWMMREVTFSV
jgi:hypothetical protein